MLLQFRAHRQKGCDRVRVWKVAVSSEGMQDKYAELDTADRSFG